MKTGNITENGKKINHKSHGKLKTALTGLVTAAALSSTTAYTLLPLTARAASSSASAASSAAAAGQNSQPQGNPPDGGNGQAPSGNPPAKPDGSAPAGNAGGGTAPSGSAPGGGQSAVTSWNAATEFTADATEDDGIYDSTGTDENAVHVSNGASVTLNNPTVTRTSSDSQGGDSSSFYGVGAAVLTTDGTTYVNGGTVTTDSKGAAGIFSYDSGVTYVAGTTISTSQNTSGGLHVAGGGKLYAWNVNTTTQGESAAAIRSDRGGGTMVIDGGTYTSNGEGSPAVYTTADISVNDATLTANGSEGVCIEGFNTLRLFDSDLTSNMQDLDENDSTWSVILYQSMSGDSEVGTSNFSMVGGSLNSKNGGLFYSTNTDSEFLLDNVNITEADDCEYFLRVSGNGNDRGWGTSGANGADTNFTAIDQAMNGDVIWDSISKLDFYMTDGSTLTGAVKDDETYAGNGGSGCCSLYIDSTSGWTVTGDSTVTNLYNEGTITDADGKTVSIVGSDGTSYVKGTGRYTITVSGTYSTNADLSGALTAPSWSDYEVSAPSQLTAVSTSASVAVDTSSDTSSETSSITSSDTPAEVTASDVADSAPENTDIAISADAGAEETEASGIRTAPLIGILAAGAAAAAAAVLLIGRKKK